MLKQYNNDKIFSKINNNIYLNRQKALVAKSRKKDKDMHFKKIPSEMITDNSGKEKCCWNIVSR